MNRNTKNGTARNGRNGAGNWKRGNGEKKAKMQEVRPPQVFGIGTTESEHGDVTTARPSTQSEEANVAMITSSGTVGERPRAAGSLCTVLSRAYGGEPA